MCQLYLAIIFDLDCAHTSLSKSNNAYRRHILRGGCRYQVAVIRRFIGETFLTFPWRIRHAVKWRFTVRDFILTSRTRARLRGAGFCCGITRYHLRRRRYCWFFFDMIEHAPPDRISMSKRHQADGCYGPPMIMYDFYEILAMSRPDFFKVSVKWHYDTLISSILEWIRFRY